MTNPGHNNPPSMIDTAGEVTASLNNWLTDHPVVENEDHARDAKVLLDRAKLCVKDMEAEREGKVKPLNLQVAAINDTYRQPRGLLQKVQQELLRRVTSFIAKEEVKRIKAAEEARKKAAEAERLAREAEQRERDALADAEVGAVSDVAEAISEADEAFAEFQRQQRAASLADREAKVKVSGGFTRSLTLRNKETLVVKDAIIAINAIGLTPDIEAAILKGARAYRTLHQELPPGIDSKTERAA